MRKYMDISVIVPIYHGNCYIEGIQAMIAANAAACRASYTVELVLVNDSPEVALTYAESMDYQIKIVNNEANLGIHQSRLNGLMASSGQYIVFLDQDDEILPCCLESQLCCIADTDMVVGNGIKQINGKNKKIYRDRWKHRLVRNPVVHAKAANQIVSPGHCLIRRDSIPEEWKTYQMTCNGSDDLFLWLLMLAKGCRFALNRKIIYTHVDTGKNLSEDRQVMCQSDLEMCDFLDQIDYTDKKVVAARRRLVDFFQDQKNTGLGKIKKFFKYLDIYLLKMYAYYI